MSGLSRFPPNCVEMSVGFAGIDRLLSNNFSDFGEAAHVNGISKKIYYEYLVKNRMTTASFDDWFPRGTAATGFSVMQGILMDMRGMASDKIEQLTVRCVFGSTAIAQSPVNTQIVVLSAHPNGKAVCQASDPYNYTWQFAQVV